MPITNTHPLNNLQASPQSKQNPSNANTDTIANNNTNNKEKTFSGAED